MAQQNTNGKSGKLGNKKPLVIAIGSAITILVLMFAWTSSNKKTAEERAAENAKETPSAVSNVDINERTLDMETNGEQGDKIRAADAMAASEAAEKGDSYIALPPNSQQDSSNINNKSNSLVAPIEASEPVVQGQIQQAPQMQQMPQIQYVQVQPVIPEQKVIEVTNIKEVPVLRYEPYKFKDDTQVLEHFVSLYGGNLGQQQQQNQNIMESKDFNAKFRQAESQRKAQEQQTKNQEQVANNQNGNENNNKQNQKEETIVVNKVGDILAAELETNIDSRRPTLVRATIAEGALQGATIVGSFSKNGDGTSVIIEFNSINIPGIERSIPIKAVAVDLATGSNAMATSVNRHAIARITYATVETMAAAFADNLSTNNQSTSQKTVTDTATGNTTTVSETSTSKKSTKEILKESGAAGISSAMSELSDLVPREATVKVSAMPFGLFITEDFKMTKKEAQELDLY